MRSIEEQVRAMESQWPGFAVTHREERTVTWEGDLAPDKRRHRVRVRVRLPQLWENVSLLEAQPRVQVIDPLLERHPDFDQGPIPHVYVNPSNADLPFLCLFSPGLRQWSFDDFVAATTIFWSAEWLYFYEGWLVTKKWQGGGRHAPRSDHDVKRLSGASV